MRGLAQFSIIQKKTLVVTDPHTNSEYDPVIDMNFKDKEIKPIICVPIFNKDVDE